VFVGRPLEETWGDINNKVVELMLYAEQQMMPNTFWYKIYTAIYIEVSYGRGE